MPRTPLSLPVVSSVTNWLCFYIISLTASNNMKSRTLSWASLRRSILFGLTYCLPIPRPFRDLLCMTRVHSSLIFSPLPLYLFFSVLVSNFLQLPSVIVGFATPRLTFGSFERLSCLLVFCPMHSATQSLHTFIKPSNFFAFSLPCTFCVTPSFLHSLSCI